MQHSTTPEILTLDEVKNHFDHWRLTRTRQGKIPPYLWDEVKTLIGRYPISKIAQALRVSAYQISVSLDNKTECTFVKAVSTSQESALVPIVETSCFIGSEVTCSFEIHRPNGSLIKISDFPVVSLANIIRVGTVAQVLEVPMQLPKISRFKLDTVILCSTNARGIQEGRLIHPMTKGFVSSGKFDARTKATICSTSSCDFSMTMGNSLAGVISNPAPLKGCKVS